MEDAPKPKFYILSHNIAKRKNVGSMIRSAVAFGVDKFFLINKTEEQIKKSKVLKQFKLSYGAHGTDHRVEYQIFNSIKEAKEWFTANNITVCGIEITENSENVATQPFRGDTVFIAGNEELGLLPQLKEICDHFVYVPQYSSKTASLNVTVATSIVLHHFAVWSRYAEAEKIGEKYMEETKHGEWGTLMKRHLYTGPGKDGVADPDGANGNPENQAEITVITQEDGPGDDETSAKLLKEEPTN